MRRSSGRNRDSVNDIRGSVNVVLFKMKPCPPTPRLFNSLYAFSTPCLYVQVKKRRIGGLTCIRPRSVNQIRFFYLNK